MKLIVAGLPETKPEPLTFVKDELRVAATVFPEIPLYEQVSVKDAVPPLAASTVPEKSSMLALREPPPVLEVHVTVAEPATLKVADVSVAEVVPKLVMVNE